VEYQLGALPPDYPRTKGGKLGLNPKLSTAAESLQSLRHPLRLPASQSGRSGRKNQLHSEE
jgi:hypothetical protein